MRKHYNKKRYGLFSQGMGIVRDHCSKDPFEKIKDLGILGQIVGGVWDKVFEPLIHKMSYNLTGKLYSKEYDSPYKGSAIYTFSKLNIKAILKLVFELIISLPVFSFIIQFFSADFVTQLRMLLGLVPLLLLVLGINRAIKWVKRLF